MDQNEIKLGCVYYCRSGWYRRPVEFTDGGVSNHDQKPYQNVRYEHGRTPEANKSQSVAPLPRFAKTVKSVVGS